MWSRPPTSDRCTVMCAGLTTSWAMTCVAWGRRVSEVGCKDDGPSWQGSGDLSRMCPGHQFEHWHPCAGAHVLILAIRVHGPAQSLGQSLPALLGLYEGGVRGEPGRATAATRGDETGQGGRTAGAPLIGAVSHVPVLSPHSGRHVPPFPSHRTVSTFFLVGSICLSAHRRMSQEPRRLRPRYDTCSEIGGIALDTTPSQPRKSLVLAVPAGLTPAARAITPGLPTHSLPCHLEYRRLIVPTRILHHFYNCRSQFLQRFAKPHHREGRRLCAQAGARADKARRKCKALVS